MIETNDYFVENLLALDVNCFLRGSGLTRRTSAPAPRRRALATRLLVKVIASNTNGYDIITLWSVLPPSSFYA